MLAKFRLLGTTGLALGLAITASPVLVAPAPAQAAMGIDILVNIAPPATRPSNVQQVHYPQPSRAAAPASDPAARPAAATPRPAPHHGNDRHGEH